MPDLTQTRGIVLHFHTSGFTNTALASLLYPTCPPAKERACACLGLVPPVCALLHLLPFQQAQNTNIQLLKYETIKNYNKHFWPIQEQHNLTLSFVCVISQVISPMNFTFYYNCSFFLHVTLVGTNNET